MTEKMIKQTNNKSQSLQYPTFENGENNQAEDQQEYRRLEHYKLTGTKRHVQNIPPNNSRMHVLLKGKPYILQNKLYTKTYKQASIKFK